jgi:hypothetical protein
MKTMVRGRDAFNEVLSKTNMELLKIEDGGSKLVRILVSFDDMVGAHEHFEKFGGKSKTVTCLDRDFNRKGECPLCEAGLFPSFKAYIPVVDRGDDNKVKILKASKTMLKMIAGLEDEYGDITARDFKISRSGNKLQTTYQFFPKDPKKEDLSVYEIPDIESRIAPLTREAILRLMDGMATDEDDSYEPVDETPEVNNQANKPKPRPF